MVEPSASLDQRVCESRARAPAPGSLTVDDRFDAWKCDEEEAECVKLGLGEGARREEEEDACEVMVDDVEVPRRWLRLLLDTIGEAEPELDVVADS